MEKEHIVKALECCAEGVTCDGCPNECGADPRCVRKTVRDALSLVREQEKRIEELEAENEKLKKPLYMVYSDGKIEMIPSVESVRADTVRKMQGRLKAEAITVQDHTGKLDSVVLASTIDQTAQQLLQENT